MKNFIRNHQTLSSPTKPNYRSQDWELESEQESFKPLSYPTGEGLKMSANSTPDCTIIYSSAHKIPEYFASNVLRQLFRAAGAMLVYEIHSTPEESSITNYYKDLLACAKDLDTPYIAFAEDDTLYPDEHFNQRPSNMDTFAYNFNRWNIFTWSQPPFFYLCQRQILGTLIAPREAFIRTMEKRLENPDESQMVEPGRKNGEPSEVFETYKPVVVFSHPDSFGYGAKRKRAGKIRAYSIPCWGTAKETMETYEDTPKPNN